jgi:hypothetical protein
VVIETELPGQAALFALDGYTTFEPISSGKKRVLTFVRSTVAVQCNARLRLDLMDGVLPSVWLEVDAGEVPMRQDHSPRAPLHHGQLIVGGVYRQWSSDGETGASMEHDQHERLIGQLERVTDSQTPALLMGDLKLHTRCQDDKSYPHRSLLNDLSNAVEKYGFEYLRTTTTWRSHGIFTDKLGVSAHHEKTLDHVSVAGVRVTVEVLADSTTDHQPLLTCLRIGGPKAKALSIRRINFKGIIKASLESALESADGLGVPMNP